MDTFFAPYDWRYTAIAFSAVVIDTYLLQRLLPLKAWWYIRAPSTLLHELAHVITAFLFGGRARIVSMAPRPLPDGTIALGTTEWTGVKMGAIGRAAVAGAPLGWIVVALMVAHETLSNGQSLLGGLGALALCMMLMGAGLRLSAADFRAMGIIPSFLALMFTLSMVVGVLFDLPLALCHWFEVACY